MTSEQRSAYEVMSARSARQGGALTGYLDGVMTGPYAVWLRVPDIALPIYELADRLRFNTKLERRLFELMVLVVGRLWSAQYEWFAHEEVALRAGLSPKVVEALRRRRRPKFDRKDEEVIYDIATELVETRKLRTSSHRRAVSALGLESTIELITSIGFYTLVAMLINSFDIQAPGGKRPLP